MPSGERTVCSRAPQGGRRSFDDAVRAGVYLTSMSDFIAMNGIYAKYFSQPFPARTMIGVAALPPGGLR
ncbi:MAG TPA: RidA family protein [Pyrinomonadaceae bacterium]|nr:RidA family protein [Pyrinomonadaceae bacterium]